MELAQHLTAYLTTMIAALDAAAIAVFAVTGALVASRKNMDIFGFILLGTATGIGGGTVRDILMGTLPVFWVREPGYLLITVLVSSLVFFTAHIPESRYRLLLWLDAVGLALFCVVGADRGLAAGAEASIAIVMGVVTAVFGGIIRDILGGESRWSCVARSTLSQLSSALEFSWALPAWKSPNPPQPLLPSARVCFCGVWRYTTTGHSRNTVRQLPERRNPTATTAIRRRCGRPTLMHQWQMTAAVKAETMIAAKAGERRQPLSKVKICGLTTPDAVEASIDAGADYIGLVLFPKSPRNVSIEDAATLAELARARTKIVTLLVDPDAALLDAVATRIMPDIVQLHGHESAEDIVRARNLVPGAQIWKAYAVATSEDVAASARFLAPGKRADLILFDAKPPPAAVLPGGNGLSFDWRILEGWPSDLPFVLAGGLTPLNVADAIRLTRASIVDVSSGVESSPGIKDAALIRDFIHAAKTAKQSA